jgi:hypothetical protein
LNAKYYRICRGKCQILVRIRDIDEHFFILRTTDTEHHAVLIKLAAIFYHLLGHATARRRPRCLCQNIVVPAHPTDAEIKKP